MREFSFYDVFQLHLSSSANYWFSSILSVGWYPRVTLQIRLVINMFIFTLSFASIFIFLCLIIVIMVSLNTVWFVQIISTFSTTFKSLNLIDHKFGRLLALILIVPPRSASIVLDDWSARAQMHDSSLTRSELLHQMCITVAT